MSAARVLVTCRQMQNVLRRRSARASTSADIELDLPDVVQQPTEDELIAIIGDFDGMIAGDDPLSARVLEHATPHADHLQVGRRHRRHRLRRRRARAASA